MNKRKYEREEEADPNGNQAGNQAGYEDAECPECGAIINTRFQRGRQTRRLHCPVCQNLVTLRRDPKEDVPDLIQIQWKSN